MKDKFDLALGWIKKGDSDLSAAEIIAKGDGPNDTSCFHVQQAIEKYLKGFLAFYEQQIPRTHDLEEIEELCQAIIPMPELTALELDELSDYAVQVRYDFDAWPEQDVAQDGVETAKKVKAILLNNIPNLEPPSKNSEIEDGK